MLATCDVIAFAPTTDLARARSFYEGALGLSVVDENAYACVVDAHGTMLRITAVAAVAHPGYTVLGWRVSHIAETVTRLASAGVAFAHYDGMGQDAHGCGPPLTVIASPGSTIPMGTSCLSRSSTDSSDGMLTCGNHSSTGHAPPRLA